MVAAIAGVATVAGAAMSSSATKKAASGQQRATDAANAESARQYDNNVALQAPAINTGNAARDRLSYLLGLSPTGYGGSTSVGGGGSSAGGGAPPLTYDSLREQMLGQYSTTKTVGGGQWTPPDFSADPMAQFRSSAETEPNFQQNFDAQGNYLGMQPRSWEQTNIDEAGLDTAIRARLAEQDAATKKAQTDAQAAAQADPKYGSLAQNFQFGTYTPDTYKAPEAYVPDTYTAPEAYVADKFSYTGQDLYDDPSYKFRLEQGQKALDRQGAASGRFLSGSQLQAASNYNQGAASQEFQNAYGRALGTFSTNEGNRAQAYNTNTTNGLNAFNTNSTNKFNAYNTNTANGLNEFNVNSTNKFNAFNTNETNRFNANQANYNNTVNPLLSLAGSAQTASGYLGSAGQQTAQMMGANLMANSNAQGAAGIANANNISGAMTGAVNNYQQNQLMNSLLNRNAGVNNNPYVASSTPAYGNNNFWTSGTTGTGS